MNASMKAAQKTMKKLGFAAHVYQSASFKIYDEGKYCHCIVDVKRSMHDDKLMLVVDKLSDMASNFREVCAKLDGVVVAF